MRLGLWVFTALLWLASRPSPAGAHAMNAALLRLEARDDGVAVMLKIPRVESGPQTLRIHMPAACEPRSPRERALTADAILESWQLGCAFEELHGQTIRVDGLDAIVGELFVHLGAADDRGSTIVLSRDVPEAALPADEPSSQGTPPPRTSRGFFSLGVEHILTGPDHLLFLLALLLLVRRARQRDSIRALGTTMAWTVTAFTVAHSLTLAGSVLDVIRLPAQPVEIVIALSVLFLAVELASAEPEATLTARYPWVVAFSFGLLHGFGFASALRDVGLPEQAVGASLLLFNLGVEAGQLAFLGLSGALWWLFLGSTASWRRQGTIQKYFERAAAYVIGSAAVFWCLQRAWMV